MITKLFFRRISIVLILTFITSYKIEALDGRCIKINRLGKSHYLQCYCNCYLYFYNQWGKCSRCNHYVEKDWALMPKKYQVK